MLLFVSGHRVGSPANTHCVNVYQRTKYIRLKLLKFFVWELGLTGTGERFALAKRLGAVSEALDGVGSNPALANFYVVFVFSLNTKNSEDG